MKVKKFKNEIFFLITNIISHAHGKKKKKVLFQTQKRSYISRNMENSWVYANRGQHHSDGF